MYMKPGSYKIILIDPDETDTTVGKYQSSFERQIDGIVKKPFGVFVYKMLVVYHCEAR